MRQIQFEYTDKEQLHKMLNKISQWNKSSMTSLVVFDIFSQELRSVELSTITAMIIKEIPGAMYRGCTTNGNILNGGYSGANTIITCTIFEYPTTKVEMIQLRLTNDTEKEVTDQLIKAVEERPWVKAVEMLVTIRGMSMTGLCEDLSSIREGVEIFGGGAFGPEFNENAAYVFSNVGECSDKSGVFMLIGGDDMHIMTTHITGWKPLGRELHVTKAKGSVLYELDGKPAYDTYYRFLKIKNDENFFTNTLEFPFFYEHKGINILRAPIASNPDGSLNMTADMEMNVKARIAYGDPWTILDSVRQGCIAIGKFQPELIHVYSCAARRTFWGPEAYKETLPMQSMAPTSGFYTSGEFLRSGKDVNQHNVTLVVAAMREGDKIGNDSTFEMDEENHSGKISMINRLANFIEAATEELEIMAVTDGLTELFNRREIQRRIDNALEKYGKDTALIMIDADNFKRVNDTYGHQKGDEVLKGLSGVIKSVTAAYGMKHCAGRWGGEEFMICVTGETTGKAEEIAERLRRDFEATDFGNAGHQTISVGVTHASDGETADSICVRVDKALYKAKSDGKNRVVVL